MLKCSKSSLAFEVTTIILVSYSMLAISTVHRLYDIVIQARIVCLHESKEEQRR